VALEAVDVEAARHAPLQDRDRVVLAREQHVDGLAAEEGRVEAVEEDRPAAALGVPDLSREDRVLRRLRAAEALEVLVPELLDEELPQRLGGAAQDDVAGGIVRGVARAELLAVL